MLKLVRGQDTNSVRRRERDVLYGYLYAIQACHSTPWLSCRYMGNVEGCIVPRSNNGPTETREGTRVRSSVQICSDRVASCVLDVGAV
jgi:hypothetical protein